MDLFGIAAALGVFLVAIAVVQEKFLVVATIAILALVIIAPVEIALGIFAFSVPFDNVWVLGNSNTSHTSLSWAAGAFAGAILLAYGLGTGRFKMPPRATLWWGLFSVWTAASTVWAINPAVSFYRLLTVAFLFALYLVTASLLVSHPEASQVLFLTIAGGAAAAALLLYQVYSIGLRYRASLYFGDRAANPNDLAASLLLPFSLALAGLLSEGRPLKRALLLAALVLIATAIFLTMSRGALVALSATLSAVLFRAGARKRMLIPIVLVTLPIIFMPESFYDRLKEAPTGRGTGRLDIFIAGIEVIKHNPVMGVGLENFTIAYDRFAGYAPVFRGRGRAAHNMYLEVWAETGLIGFALFIAAIYYQLKRVRPPANCRLLNYWEIGVGAGCWGLLVAGFAGNIQWSKEFWLCLILLAVIMPKASSIGIDSSYTCKR